MIAYLFVILPLALYLPLFGYETYAAWRRIGRPGKKGAYVHASWEVTHTFLIIGITNFVWLFSGAIKPVSKAVYWGLITAGALFILRAVLYLYLFFAKDPGQGNHSGAADWLFFFSHLGILAGLVYVLGRGAQSLSSSQFTVNEQFIPWMWPGLILLLVLGTIPLLRVYTARD
jgi:cytochrome bd-type quinol oxidase subunit 2